MNIHPAGPRIIALSDGLALSRVTSSAREVPARIAILEDNPRQREALAHTLADAPGYDLAGAFATLTELRRALPRLACDAALVDIQLPDGTGIDAIRLLRQQPSPAPRCIVLTVLNDSRTLFAALEAGADGYLLKRGDPKGLLSRLGELLAGEIPMSPAIARRLLEHFRQRPTGSDASLGSLTTSEHEVLGLLARGHSNQEIAEARKVALPTVRSQLSAIYQKLQVRSRTEAVALFHRRD